MNHVLSTNTHLLLLVNAFAARTPVLHTPIVLYTTYGVVLFGAMIIYGIVRTRHAPSRVVAAAIWSGIAPLIAVALNQPLGRLVHERRPYVTHTEILRLVPRTTDFSFPSDHAVMAGAVAAALLILNRRLGAVAWALALVMAASRVYVGAHYPLDVIAGLAFGGGVSLLGWNAAQRPLTTLIRRARTRQPWAAAFGRT